MRLVPGTSLEHADRVLREAETTWGNARAMSNPYLDYTDAVHRTYATLRQVFAVPDLGGGLHSATYWHVLSNQKADYQAIGAEIEVQVETLKQARRDLDELKKLATQPGLPIVYDTNMLNHWQQPGDIRWRDVLRARTETSAMARLVIPLRVLDELDKQKYGRDDGDLARKAATAIRYLERILRDGRPGRPVRLRDDATLEVWSEDDRGGDADLAILRCAADLHNLCSGTGARVLTADLGMRMRAHQMGLQVLELPEGFRKPGTAIGEQPPQ
jgi:hypothetical protein